MKPLFSVSTAHSGAVYLTDVCDGLGRMRTKTNFSWTGTWSPGPSQQYLYNVFDDENRLISVYGPNLYRADFLYDGLGRMRMRTNSTWNGTSWSPGPVQQYIYDGWRVIQERTNDVPTVSYTRGRDLSGSLEGAGGIGGLLARSHGYSAGNWSTHSFYFADGNGNIVRLLNSGQAVVASYRYDPFGNATSFSGALATANTYRFSSKEAQLADTQASPIYYYGYRFYDPILQRWLNRDPIAEEGGMNLFGYAYNNPISFIDPLGLCKVEVRYAKLGSIFGLSWYHAYVVVTEPDGSQTYYRGGPSAGGPSSGSSGAIGSGSGGSSSQKCCRSSQSNSSNSSNSSSPGSSPGGRNNGPWGKISTQSGPYVPGTIDWDPNPSPTVVVQDDGQPCGCKNNLQSALDRINNANVPYNPFGDNSNAAAHQIIEDAGFPRPKPPVWAPGSGNKLP